MEETAEILAAKIAGVYDDTILLPNMEIIASDPNSTKHQKEHIDEFTTASKTLGQWLQNYQGDAIVTNTVEKWKQTCDRLTCNPHFTDGWSLPAFYPIYSHQCWNAIDLFFDTSRAVYPE